MHTFTIDLFKSHPPPQKKQSSVTSDQQEKSLLATRLFSVNIPEGTCNLTALSALQKWKPIKWPTNLLSAWHVTEGSVHQSAFLIGKVVRTWVKCMDVAGDCWLWGPLKAGTAVINLPATIALAARFCHPWAKLWNAGLCCDYNGKSGS